MSERQYIPVFAASGQTTTPGHKHARMRGPTIDTSRQGGAVATPARARIPDRLPLSDAKRAHEMWEVSAGDGKVVLVP